MRVTVIGIEHDLIPRRAAVQCDECGDQYAAGQRFMRPEAKLALAQALRDVGWDVDNEHTHHICPDCRKA